jgi:hypothetical protein
MKPKKEVNVEILAIQQGRAEFCLVGTEPLVFNRKTTQLRQSMLLPPRPKSRGEKMTRLKHDPIAEFRDSVYRFDDPKSPTLLGIPSPAFKGAISSAALDIQGAAKSQVGRLTYVAGYWVPIYGLPLLFMADVKQAGVVGAPDIRTRAIVPQWACRLTVGYVRPNLNQRDVTNLLAAAGIVVGVGDYRQQKGRGNFGLWRLVPPDDADFKRIVETGGRAAQEAAMKRAECFNTESFDLLAWFRTEAHTRGFSITQPEG